jgi:hypothetical protein
MAYGSLRQIVFFDDGAVDRVVLMTTVVGLIAQWIG